MSDWVVECPDCRTQFRVTLAHRTAAEGLVRCGACLSVFVAAEGRLEEPVEADRDAGHAHRHRSVLDVGDRVAASSPEEARTASLDIEAALDAVGEERVPDLDMPIAFDGARMRLDEITPLPVPPPARRWPWWLLSAAGVLLLMVQAVVWQFDALALDPEQRPRLAQLCAVVGCDLPVPTDRAAIRTQRLLVRSHPERADGLRVEVVLINGAPWPQPFPDMRLSFSTIEGAPLAARRFAPAEYLAGELAGRRQMPAGSPVQIALDLVDPGPQAVNYELELL
ncbi:MAG TPA: zinc-ribbon and DUF3426 domain-containing protein [Pseudomonadales bacterium]|nr:zinc-ribbon and DUF3426 domain-containing protein [Pseudomonadales bacterium]